MTARPRTIDRLTLVGTLAALLGLAMAGPARVAAGPRVAAAALPDKLSDSDFWKLETDISEPGGYFRIADNFTSNEGEVGQVMTMLRESGVKGGVYIGVGPEQNFSYIAAVRPAMAFVIDIRRQAVMQHLLFKAAFELSEDRADFISFVFAKPRPAGLTKATSIQDIWNAFIPVPTDMALAKKNYDRAVQELTKTQAFVFTADEMDQLEWVDQSFVGYGPAISTRGGVQGGFGGNNWTFADLTGWAADGTGQPQSFLSTDDNYQFLRTLQQKNLLVPVSGDFGGPKALRAIGSYVRAQGGTVSAFYVSNVEQYLFQDGKDGAFYDNVATLPINDKTVFIRPYAMRGQFGAGRPLCPIGGLVKAAKAGQIRSNNDALACAF
jgi:hypothetical protein